MDQRADFGNMIFMKTPWIAVIVAAVLLLGCSSLTPERVNVIAGIAGQAAAFGAADWLAKHPEHRQAFMDALAELGAVVKTDDKGAQSIEDAAVSFLAKLPTGTLRGKDGEVYVTGDTNGPASLVVWDPVLKKGVEVEGEAARPVVKQLYMGLRRALSPQPPAPVVVVARARKPGDLEGRTAEGGTPPPLSRPVVGAATNNAVASTFDVTLNEHGIQQVNVRWIMDPNTAYTVQRREDKDWEGFASATNTNAVSTTCLWRTLWHHQCPVGIWRVVRR